MNVQSKSLFNAILRSANSNLRSKRWGQAYILESLMFLQGPIDSTDAELLAERVFPRLQHANSAVVLTAIKVVMFLIVYIPKEEVLSNLLKRLGPPLGTR